MTQGIPQGLLLSPSPFTVYMSAMIRRAEVKVKAMVKGSRRPRLGDRPQIQPPFAQKSYFKAKGAWEFIHRLSRLPLNANKQIVYSQNLPILSYGLSYGICVRVYATKQQRKD
ncbi:hypothetical protein EV426DRAFT_706768 [Tirmania nivea]|nr:hypothetical protein EV426DRAFT_706768 [Tirmania nivea]